MNREQDIRQSDGWGKYLETLGWKIRKTSSGILIDIKPTFLGNLVKIQRPKKVDEKDLEEIEKICREEKCAYIKIEPDYGQETLIFDEAGYKNTFSPNAVPSTIFIDLSKSEEELWGELSHSAKYSVTRAVREGFTVEVIKNPSIDLLKESYEVFITTAKSKHFYLSPFSQYSNRVGIFGERSYLCIGRDAEGKIQASKYCLGHKDMVLFVTGGATGESRKNKSGYLLMWEAIKFFKKEGYSCFDLEGKEDKRFPLFTKHWEGFSDFKEKFGGIPIEFPIPKIKYLNRAFKIVSGLPWVSF